MKSLANFVLDDYVSPKILAGPYASEASREAAAELKSNRDYQELAQRLKAVGFFAPAPRRFALRMIAFTLLYAAGFVYLLTNPGTAGLIVAWVVVGFAHVHGNFIAHDAGHGAISRDRRVAAGIGHFFDTFLGGYSVSYFRRSHDLHHYHCNEADRDPNTMASLFTLTEQSLPQRTAVTRVTTRWQHVLIPIVYPLWSFALRTEGFTYTLRNLRAARVDAVLLIAHFALWFTLPVIYLGVWGALVNYVAMTMVTGVYVSIVIPPNHVGMPVLDSTTAGSFIAQQVTTSRNLPSSPLRDFLYLGQNSQIEHHLFPFAPTCNLGRGREVVREFCRERGLRYHECTYVEALREVHGQFARMASHAAAGPAEQVDPVRAA